MLHSGLCRDAVEEQPSDHAFWPRVTGQLGGRGSPSKTLEFPIYLKTGNAT